MNCSLHKSEFRLCLEVVLDWLFRFADQWCARLAESGLRPLALCCTFDHGWVVCTRPSVFVPIGLHTDYPPCDAYREFRVHFGSPTTETWMYKIAKR